MKKLIPSLPDNAHLADVFRKFPANVRPLLEYHDLLLRGPSDLSVAERELIAAYVSGLNACAFCRAAHTIYARAFGIEPETIDALLANPATAPVDAKLKPVLAYVAKLTETPSKVTEADAQAVYAAGWSEAALFDAVQVCALFNFMNRIVEGSGVAPYPEDPRSAGEDALKLRRERRYKDFGRQIGVLD